jgi:hypothetical protein
MNPEYLCHPVNLILGGSSFTPLPIADGHVGNSDQLGQFALRKTSHLAPESHTVLVGHVDHSSACTIVGLTKTQE